MIYYNCVLADVCPLLFCAASSRCHTPLLSVFRRCFGVVVGPLSVVALNVRWCFVFGPFWRCSFWCLPSLTIISLYKRELARKLQNFSCSTQLALEFILLINVKMPTILIFISKINITSESIKVRTLFIFQHFIFMSI